LSSKIREGEDWIYLIPALTSIAWLFNFRCEGDVEGCPIAYAYAAVTKDKAILFVEEAKVQDESLRARFEADGIEIRPYGVKEIEKFVKDWVGKSALREKKSGFKLWAPKECSWALQEACKPVSLSFCGLVSLLIIRMRFPSSHVLSKMPRPSRMNLRSKG